MMRYSLKKVKMKPENHIHTGYGDGEVKGNMSIYIYTSV